MPACAVTLVNCTVIEGDDCADDWQVQPRAINSGSPSSAQEKGKAPHRERERAHLAEV